MLQCTTSIPECQDTTQEGMEEGVHSGDRHLESAQDESRTCVILSPAVAQSTGHLNQRWNFDTLYTGESVAKLRLAWVDDTRQRCRAAVVSAANIAGMPSNLMPWFITGLPD